MLTINTVAEILPLLKATIKEAGETLLKYYGSDVRTFIKKDRSPVTEADFASQKILLDGLRQFGYPILSEELEDTGERFKHPYVWIIDPLDGTKDFLQKTGEFCIMVGLVFNGTPVFGAIYQPTEKRLCYAVKSLGAYCENIHDAKPMKLGISQTHNNNIMLVSRNHATSADHELGKFLNVSSIIPCGSVGVKAYRIANSEAAFSINLSSKTGEWDTCAADIIIQEANGIMSDTKGETLLYNKPIPRNERGFVISCKSFHKRVLEALKAISK